MIGTHRYAWLLAFALAGCGSGGSSPAGVPSSSALMSVAAAAPDAYAACRERADGDAPALIACADQVIAETGRGVDSPVAAGAFRAALQEMSDQVARDGGQAARATFADRAVEVARARAALLSGRSESSTPKVAAVAPDVGGATWARSRMLSCQEHQVPDCAARYDGLLSMFGDDDDRGEIPITKPASLTGLPLPTCAEVRADGRVGDALVDAFGARYPKALVSPDSVETVALDSAAIDNAVDYVACVASATDFDPMVAENSLALFASHRHGKAALARLAALRKTGDPAAKEFEEQIKGYLKGPGE